MDQSLLTQVTEEEFYAFHKIDRQVFFRLTFILRREPFKAMQAIAFWLWLERLHRSYYVHTILTYPDNIVETVFEETLLALKAAESVDFYALDDANDLPILQNIVGKERVNLWYFHENRMGVVFGVGNIVQQICLRAFQDLIQIVLTNMGLPPFNYYMFHDHPLRNINSNSGDNTSLGHSFMVQDSSVPLKDPFHFPPLNSGITQNGTSISNNTNISNNYFPPVLQENHLRAKLACMETSDDHQFGEIVLPPRERTIFLTFSKGYPISESELRDFLYRSFGDIIETLYMQEVSANEQPLYAKLVVRDARVMHVVLSDQGKAKFSINGRHVWARKYVRKNPTSPPSSPN